MLRILESHIIWRSFIHGINDFVASERIVYQRDGLFSIYLRRCVQIWIKKKSVLNKLLSFRSSTKQNHRNQAKRRNPKRGMPAYLTHAVNPSFPISGFTPGIFSLAYTLMLEISQNASVNLSGFCATYASQV